MTKVLSLPSSMFSKPRAAVLVYAAAGFTTEVEVEVNYQIDYGHQNEVESSR